MKVISQAPTDPWGTESEFLCSKGKKQRLVRKDGLEHFTNLTIAEKSVTYQY